MDDLEILTYGHTGRLTLQAALRGAQNAKKKGRPAQSGADSGSGSDGEGRARKRKNEAKKDVVCIGDDSLNESSFTDKDVIDLSVCSKKSCLSPPSRSPSPLPPPDLYTEPPARDKKAQKRLKKADDLLSKLKAASSFSSPGASSLDLSEHESPCSTVLLRIRCRGRMHKCCIQTTAPLLQVCENMAAQLGVASKQIMLSHKTDTLNLSKSPDSAGLTTVDIIDAIILSESEAASKLNTSLGNSFEHGQSITIKIQSSKKHITYSLNRSEPLEKAMKAFAAELNVAVSKISFSFDGDAIDPRQTAEDLDMECDDVIDARVL